MTKVDIIKETAEFYAEDPGGRRAVSPDGVCFYFMEDGRTCAAGRCLKHPKRYKDSSEGAAWLLRELRAELKEKYKEHESSYQFWVDLQSLHDINAFWNEDGLTPKGEAQLGYLIRDYDTGEDA